MKQSEYLCARENLKPKYPNYLKGSMSIGQNKICFGMTQNRG